MSAIPSLDEIKQAIEHATWDTDRIAVAGLLIRLLTLLESGEVAIVSKVKFESDFAELISTELDHYAQKVAKGVLRKALGGK